MQPVNELDKRVRINSVYRGLLLGLVSIISSVGAYYMITGLQPTAVVFIFLPTALSVLLPILVVILLLFNLRKSIGGYWNFKQATSGIFVMFLTAYLLHTVCYDIFFSRVIEPDMLPKTEASAIAANRFLMGAQHQPQAKIDQSVEGIKKGFEQQRQVTTGKILQGVFIYIIFIFLFSLIFASLFKKEPYQYTDQATG